MNKRRVTYSKGKAKNKKYTLKRLWDYIYRFRFLFIMAFILNIISNVLTLIGPYIIGKIIDVIKEGASTSINFTIIYRYAILMAISYVVSAVISLFTSLLIIKISKKIVYAMRHDAYEKLLDLPIAFFDTNQTGDIISRMSYDIDTVNTSLSTDLIQVCTSVITIVGSFIMMLVESPILVLVFVITLPVAFLFTNIMVKKTSKYFKARSKSLGELNGFMEEMITGSKTIKTYGKEQAIIENFDECNVKAAKATYMAEYYSAYTGPGVNFVNNLSLSLICLFGAILYKLEYILLGTISSFSLYSRKFLGPINEVANIITDLQSSLAAAERVFELIDEEKEPADLIEAHNIDEVIGNVSFNNVYFGYQPDQMILKDVSFFAKAGKVIAIVGPTGAGKTTIVNLLMRFYEVNEGIITLDNEPVDLIKRSDVRKSYAMVLQETWLFDGSIYDNLTYGSENATKEEVEKVLEKARLSSFVNQLPNGYDTIIKDGGSNISKGQKQLLTIARAMLLNANMLILDEATSNVDTRTEIKIQEAMKELMKDKTTFIIAHRLSTIQSADLILAVKDGNIIEQGNHQELLNQHGFYYELYNSQFK